MSIFPNKIDLFNTFKFENKKSIPEKCNLLSHNLIQFNKITCLEIRQVDEVSLDGGMDAEGLSVLLKKKKSRVSIF